MENLGESTQTKYVHSEKIKNRRRSLFPSKNTCETENYILVDCQVSQLNPNVEFNDKQDLSKIASTNLISEILSTPRSKSVREQPMSPQYHSPSAHTRTCTDSSQSPTRHLKTPNDSNIQSVLPKLSRRSILENITDCDVLNTPSLSMSSKSSKVRTSLFPENELTFAPKQFYPTKNVDHQDVPKKSSEKIILTKISNTKKKKVTVKRKKKRTGQINAGVYHSIKKPKENKTCKTPTAVLQKIKTYKKESVVRSEFDNFLKELEDLSKKKEIKLIQHLPSKDISKDSEDTHLSSLKRLHDSEDDTLSKRPKIDSDITILNTGLAQEIFDDVNTELEVECTQDINEILLLLDNDNVGEDKENESLKPNTSGENNTDTLMSPTSEMCTMTSGMKLDSPKKVKNLNLLFQSMSEDTNTVIENQQQEQNNDRSECFPTLYQKLFNSDKELIRKEFCNKKKKMKVSSDQMLLDAGQKHFGLVSCAECSYVYNAGDPTDEDMHEKHHNISHILQFPGWKNEHVLENFLDGSRVIQVLPQDSKIWIEKTKRVIEAINREIGIYDEIVDLHMSKVLLLIMNKTIIGCLVAESKAKAYKVLQSDGDGELCSTEEYPIKCGVSLIWVSQHYRRKGIATKLMDLLLFHFDNVLKKTDIAMCLHTTDGKLFATKYFQTSNFLTY